MKANKIFVPFFKSTCFGLAVLLSLVLCVLSAAAEENPKDSESGLEAAPSSVDSANDKKKLEKKKKPKRNIKLDFEDDLVEGQYDLPSGMMIDQKKNYNYKKMIRIRENFNDEMENGLEEFKGR